MERKTDEELRQQILNETQRLEEEKKEKERKKLLKKEMEKEKKKVKEEDQRNDPDLKKRQEKRFLHFVYVFCALSVTVLTVLLRMGTPMVEYTQDSKTGFCFAYSRAVIPLLFSGESLAHTPCSEEVLKEVKKNEEKWFNK